MKCDSLNAKSRAAALRLGFTFEGIFRQHRIVRQRNRDTAWFSLLDGEWPHVRDNLRRWLYDNKSGTLSLTALNDADAT
ncbi:MAG: GNAT family protein [Candidatus Latescibacterota bacterium]